MKLLKRLCRYRTMMAWKQSRIEFEQGLSADYHHSSAQLEESVMFMRVSGRVLHRIGWGVQVQVWSAWCYPMMQAGWVGSHRYCWRACGYPLPYDSPAWYQWMPQLMTHGTAPTFFLLQRCLEQAMEMENVANEVHEHIVQKVQQGHTDYQVRAGRGSGAHRLPSEGRKGVMGTLLHACTTYSCSGVLMHACLVSGVFCTHACLTHAPVALGCTEAQGAAGLPEAAPGGAAGC